MHKFIVLLLVLSACASEDSIKIGAVLPLTGTASLYGENIRQGIELAVKEVNANGGVNGKPIEIIYEDDATNPAKSLTAVKKLIEIDGVEVIIGGIWDFLANAVIPEIDKQKVVLISPQALPDTITEKSDYFFSFHSPVSSNQKIFEEWLKNQSSARVGVIVVQNPWGLAHRDTFRKAANAVNVEIVDEFLLQSFDNNDFSTELSKLKSKNIDALFATMNFNDDALLAKKSFELDLKIPLLVHENFLGAVSEGKIPAAFIRNMTIFRFSDPSNEFMQKFKAEYGKAPQFGADIAYDAVYGIVAAMENETSAESVRQKLHKIDFNGASGRIYLGENNYPYNKQPLLEVLTP